MMTVLSWDIPPQAIPKEAWQAISADSAPPGVYTPNMSKADQQKWKAKLIGTKTGKLRVEIRKSIHGSEMVIKVYLGEDGLKVGKQVEGNYGWYMPPGCQVRISANGPMSFSIVEFSTLYLAVLEAVELLQGMSQQVTGQSISGEFHPAKEEGDE